MQETMESTVFDILVYVFDHYMFEELPVSAERADIARDLETAGFGGADVERALDWLADLADERERPGLGLPANERSLRLYSADESGRLDADCRGLLLSLESGGILSPTQREIVIDRLLALEAEELNLEQVKWVVLMVLSCQPGQEAACERMENLVYELPGLVPH
jgi:Smg protein